MNMAHIILTRPQRAAEEFANEFEVSAQKLCPNCAYKIDIKPLRQLIPAPGAISIPKAEEILLISSANAFAFIPFDLKGRRIMVVGHETAQKARALGGQIDHIFANAQSAIDGISKLAPCQILALTANPTSANYQQALASTGHQIRVSTIYEAKQLHWSAQERRNIMQYSTSIYPVFSKASFGSLWCEISKFGEAYSCKLLPFSAAISSDIERVLTAHNAPQIQILPPPRHAQRSAMIDDLCAAICNLG